MIKLDSIICGNIFELIKEIPDNSIDCIVTSPPYFGMRAYPNSEIILDGWKGSLGLEPSFKQYIEHLLLITIELKRILKPSGTLFWNHGDGHASKGSNNTRFWHGDNPGKHRLSDNEYAGRCRSKEFNSKTLILQNYRLIIKMVDDQDWLLRNVLIWHKPNCATASVKDRYTVDFEPVFFFTKNGDYYFDMQYEALRNRERMERRSFNPDNKDRKWKPNSTLNCLNLKSAEKSRQNILKNGRHPRCVMTIPTKGLKEPHFSAYPEALVQPFIMAGSPEHGIIFDPFVGSGTTCLVAKKLNRHYIGIDINPVYVSIAEKRIKNAL